MLFSFSEMAFGDKAWFVFDFTSSLMEGDFIVGTPTVTTGPGISLDAGTIVVKGTSVVTCRITAGSIQVGATLSCSITTNDGIVSTRSGVVPVKPLVPS
jgi:hypothetical protein